MLDPLSDDSNNSLIEIFLRPDFIILIQSNKLFSKFTRFLDTEPIEAGKTTYRTSKLQTLGHRTVNTLYTHFPIAISTDNLYPIIHNTQFSTLYKPFV